MDSNAWERIESMSRSDGPAKVFSLLISKQCCSKNGFWCFYATHCTHAQHHHDFGMQAYIWFIRKTDHTHDDDDDTLCKLSSLLFYYPRQYLKLAIHIQSFCLFEYISVPLVLSMFHHQPSSGTGRRRWICHNGSGLAQPQPFEL
jgi:hypothetical protein